MKNQYLISVTQAAKEFGIGRTRLYELVYTDSTLPCIKIGKFTKINKPLFQEWINKATKEGRAL